MIIKQAWRQITNRPKFFLLFLLNLSLGLSGLVSVQGLRMSMESDFRARSVSLMGADLEIAGRGQLSDEVFLQLSQDLAATKTARGFGLYNMMRFDELSRLVHVRSFSEGFPFYGEFILSESLYPFNHHQRDDLVWIYPEISTQMGVALGDTLYLGQEAFKVAGIIEDDPQQAMTSLSLAPRVYISAQGLERAGLISFGSVVWYSYYFQLPQQQVQRLQDSDAEIERIQEWIDTPSLNVLTPERSSDQMLQVFHYMTDFLGLVSLVALFLASVGMIYLYRSYLLSQELHMAIYRALGLEGYRVSAIYLSQLLILGIAGSLLGLILGQGILSLLLLFARTTLALEVYPVAPGLTLILQVFSMGILSILLLVGPLLAPISKLPVNQVIMSGSSQLKRFELKSLALWIPWPLFYFFLSVSVAHSWKIGAAFFSLFLLTPVVLYPLLILLLKGLSPLVKRLPFIFKMAGLYLVRFKVASITSFLALTLAALLLNIIPMIQKGLIEELIGEDTEQHRPSLFLFDIQEEQVSQLKSFIAENEADLIDLSPMVRGRLRKVNSQDFVPRRHSGGRQTREEERAEQFQNRGLNLTFRGHLNASEEVIAGRFFEGKHHWQSGQMGEVSLERRYAERMGLELGDIIEVEVLGMPVEAKVTSLRRIRWTTFLPNFFLLFQPGLIDDAPKVYLAAIGPMSDRRKDHFQLKMFQQFPTISILDTTRVVSRVMGLMEQMAQALYAMAFMSFVVGVLVLFSINSHQMLMKSKDVVLLKAQGLAHGKISWIFRVEIVFIAFFASLSGSLLGIAASYLVSQLFFDGVWVFDMAIPLLVTLLLLSGALLVSELVMKKVLSIQTRQVLESGPH